MSKSAIPSAPKAIKTASGKIVKILVDDSSPVEFDQPLFLVETV